MEEERVNIAELLKDCPKGTKLYSPICGECELDKVRREKNSQWIVDDEEMLIDINSKSGFSHSFNEYGKFIQYGGECLIFPSKDVRNWNYWKAQYVKLTNDKKRNFALIKLLDPEDKLSHHDFSDYDKNYMVAKDIVDGYLALIHKDEELYPELIARGIELKLEEEEGPKFKVGDVVIDTNGVLMCLTEEPIYEDFIGAKVKEATAWRLATPEEIAKWNEEVLQLGHLHYDSEQRKIIDWFLPFEKVVVREDYNHRGNKVWHCGFFDMWCGDDEDADCKEYPYLIIGNDNSYKECLPYNEETAKLIGTTDDYKEE